MFSVLRVTSLVVASLVLGACSVFLLCAGAALVALAADASVSIPWVYTVWPTEVNGLPALSFVPHVRGAAGLSVLVAAAYVLYRVRTARPR
ncbi:hypothetical protein D5R93_01435 [Actinomyces lilanjuaniae]|uniref:Uncharacterized protein n=1 Tax=Actinomyces lilanjuaniae TaxID=2321394 RepID=A0ABN5PLM4_9ACTO|nr:hypothetical protein [Actinomyces lilanjuaniae]AYD89051.1 hypothetical protein D5R93_01435 [Actinomyces lilanjuaniae]